MKRHCRVLVVVVLIALALLATGLNYTTLRSYAYMAVRSSGRAWPAFAPGNWESLQSGSFVLYFREGEPLMGEILEHLEESLQALLEHWELDMSIRIPVRVHPTQSSISRAIGFAQGDTLGAYYLGRIELLSPTAWIGGDNKQWILSYYVENGPVVHELAHLLLDYHAHGNYPMWFTEGVAQYWEARLTDYVWEEPGIYWREHVVSLRELQRSFGANQPLNAAYRQSLSKVDFLYSELGVASMQEIYRQLGQGLPLDRAMYRVAGFSLAEFERAWLISEGLAD